MSKKEPLEVIEQIELTKLHPFPDHPFGVRDDDSMALTPDEIKTDNDVIINFFGGMEITTSAGVWKEQDFNSPKSSRAVAYIMLNRKTSHSALAIADALYPEDGSDIDTMVDELLSIFARFEDYDGIHHFATQALNLVPENVKAQYWLVYSIYHSGVVALAKREIEKAKCRLTSEEFDTLQSFISKDESLPYGQLFE